MTETFPRSILITGASSGIGAALAKHYAAPGVSLFLSGRSADRLADVAAACRTTGAAVDARPLDVRDEAAMSVWIAEADRHAPLDLIVANAGISGGPGDGGAEPPDAVREIFAVNLNGVLNTVLPAVQILTARGRGQIAVVSSLAGFRGFPSAPAYSASKAAVKAMGEALRGQLRPSGISVSVICPGFVESRITDANDFPMPLLMPADRAARIIARGLARRKGLIAFPLRLALAVRLLDFLPFWLTDRLLSRLPKKG